MKKTIVIILIAVLVISGSIIGAIILLPDKENKTDSGVEEVALSTETVSIGWMRPSTVSDLEKYAEFDNKVIEYGSDSVYVHDLSFGDDVATFCYKTDAGMNVIGLSVGQILVNSVESNDTFIMEDITTDQFSEKIKGIMDWISEGLGLRIDSNYNIFTYDGDILSVDEESSYQQILDGNAYLNLRILDSDDSVWVLEIEKIETYNIISCILDHYSADSEEAQWACDVYVG